MSSGQNGKVLASTAPCVPLLGSLIHLVARQAALDSVMGRRQSGLLGRYAMESMYLLPLDNYLSLAALMMFGAER